MSEKYRRQYRRLCRRYFGGISVPGLRGMCEAWKRETYVRSQSLSFESAVKYPHVGRGNIQISPPLGEQDQSNAPPQGRQRQSNPHPMSCTPPPPAPLYRDYLASLLPLVGLPHNFNAISIFLYILTLSLITVSD